MPNVDRTTRRGRFARACLAAIAALGPAFVGLKATSAPGQENGATDDASPIRRHLEAKLAANPADAGAWRLLGRLHLQAGRLAEAERSLERSILIDPLGVAAHFDFATAMEKGNRTERAAEHFRRVVELAPASEYAAQAQAA